MAADANILIAAKYLGGALAMGLGAIGSAIGEGFTASRVTPGMVRQRAVTGELLRTMLIGQAISESAGIFALVIALVLVFGGAPTSMDQAWAVVGAGLAMGIGAIGSGTGTGIVSGFACEAIARRPDVRGRITGTMLISQALADSPGIFALVISLFLVFQRFPGSSLVKSAALLGAGVAMGAGAIGPGLGIGFVGGKACEAVTANVRVAPLITRTMLIGMAVAESTSIYSFVIAALLIFVV